MTLKSGRRRIAVWRLVVVLALLTAGLVFPDRNLSLQRVQASDGIAAYVSAPFVQGPPSTYAATIEEFENLSGCPSPSAVGTFSGTCSSKQDQWGGATTSTDTPTVGGTASRYVAPSTSFTVSFTAGVRYIGFWWSSGSGGNTVKIFTAADSVNPIATFTSNTINTLLGATAPNPYPGSGVLTSLDGSTYNKGYYFGRPAGHVSTTPTSLPAANPESHAYLNIFASGGVEFSKAEFSGTGFELDNLAVSTSLQTPVSSLVFVESVLGKSVNFLANGGSGTMAAQTSTTSAALTANTFTRDGFTFSGWNTAADGSGTTYADGATYNFSSDLSLHAQWTAVPNAPGSPTGLGATRADGQVALSWTAPVNTGSSAITDYLVEYSSDAGSSWTTFVDGVSTSTAATVTGLVNGTSYSFRVSAINSAGTGSPSSSISIAAGVLPGAPTSVRVVAGARQVAVSWTAPTSTGTNAITDYEVQYSSNSGSTWTTFADGTSTGTTAVVTGLTNGTSYVFRVAAVTTVGTGVMSSNSSSVSPSATLTFEATAAGKVTLGALATRTHCGPLTKQGFGPFEYSGTDSNGQPYSYVSNRNESGTTLRAGFEYSSGSVTGTRSVNQTSPASVGTRSGVVMLSSNASVSGFNNTCNFQGSNVTVYGSIFGPEVYTAPFSATAGQSVAVDWAAAGGSDDYEVYAFLVRVADSAAASYGYGTNANHSILLYSRGVSQQWVTATGAIPSDGVYRFRFVNGSFDYTGGKALGATMYIDPNAVVGDTNTITFGELSDRITSATNQTFSISASAASGGIVQFATSPTSRCTVGASTLSGGASTATVTVLANQTGLCTVSADSAATGTYATAQTVTRSFTIRASATAPINSGGTRQSGTVALGSTLTIDEGSWADGGATITGTTYQWQRSANNSTWSDISGATNDTYEVIASDVGNYLRVRVTKTNSVGSTTANGTATGVVPDTRLTSLALSVGSLSPAFSSGTLAYTSDASAGDSSITITPVASSGSATVTVTASPGSVTTSGSNRTITLSEGANTITIVVTLSSVSTTTTLTVTKAAGPVITAPAAPTFASNTAGQDPGDFVITGFDASATLSVSIGFVDPPAGTAFVLPVVTSLTAGSGYNFSGGKTQITFTGTQAAANAALAAMTVTTGSSTGNVVIRVTASVNRANTYYNPINGHYYEYFSTPVHAWHSADTTRSAIHLAETKTLYGVTGYLATITTAQEQKFIYENFPYNDIWIGATDDFEVLNARCAGTPGWANFANQAAAEGKWYWVTGPAGEKCTQFWEGATSGSWINSSTNATQSRTAGNIATSRYENWCRGNAGSTYALTSGRSMTEPNNWGNNPGEQFALEKWSGDTCWNDWGTRSGGTQAYIVEYSGSFSGGLSASAVVTGEVDVLSPSFSVGVSRTSGVGPFVFTVTFGVAVSGVGAVDFEDAGVGSSCSYSVSAVSATVYELSASGCFSGSAEGTVVPRFKANGATRADGVNSSTGPLSSVVSEVGVTRDVSAPSVVSFSSTSSSGSYRAGQSIVIRASMNEDVQAGGSIVVTLDTGASVTLTAASVGTVLSGTYVVGVGESSAGVTVVGFTVGSVLDVAGNALVSTSVPSGVNNVDGVRTIVVDTTAPVAIGVPSLDAASDTGKSSSDRVTSDNTPTVSVVVADLEVGATGRVRASKAGSSNVVCVLSAGSCTLGSLADGVWSIVSYQTDAAGNEGPVSDALVITVDRTAPVTVTLARVGATSVSSAISFTVTGSEDLDCSTLSTVAGVDFVLTGISSISSIVQTSSAVCTVNAVSTAVAGGVSVVSSLAAAGSFSVADIAGNAKTTLTGSPQSITVTVPAPPVPETTTTTVPVTTTSTVAPAVVTTTTVRPRRTTTTTTVRRVVTTSTTSTISGVPTTSSTLRPLIVTTSTTVRPTVTTTVRPVVTTSTVAQRVLVEVVVTTTTLPAGSSGAGTTLPGGVSSTTLPLTQIPTADQLEREIAQRESNVQDLSLPVFVNNELPTASPESPLVIQTSGDKVLDIITVNEQVVQLQDSQGFRLSVSATDNQGNLTKVNTRGAIVVSRRNYITVTGEGFMPNSDAVAWLFSQPRRLGVVRVAADGTFEESLQIADDVPEGNHTTQVNGLTPEGEVRSLNLAVEVIDTPTITDTTIDPILTTTTGPRDNTPWWIGALLLVAISAMGFGVILGMRRRRNDEDDVRENALRRG